MADGGSCCQLLTTGLVAVDAQLRFQRLPLWSANSAPWTVRDGAGRKPVPSDDRASPGRAGPPTGAEAQLGCDDISILLLASKDRGAAEVQALGRDRRRAAMGIHCAMPAEERRGWMRQRWRRVLEIQKQLHAADYALFLLAGRYRMDTHAPADTSARKQQHGRRAAPPNHRAHPPPRGSSNLSVHPLLQHAQHARNFRQQYRSQPTTSTFHTSAGGPSSAQAAPTNAAPPSSQASLLSPLLQAAPGAQPLAAPGKATRSGQGRSAINGLIAAVSAYRHSKSSSMASPAGQAGGGVNSPPLRASQLPLRRLSSLQRVGSGTGHQRAMSMMHTLLDFSPVSFTPSASAPPLLRSASSEVQASLQPNQQVPASSLAAVLLHATGSVDGEQPGVRHVEARSTLARNLLRQGSVTSPPLVVSPSSAPQQGHHPVAGPPQGSAAPQCRQTVGAVQDHDLGGVSRPRGWRGGRAGQAVPSELTLDHGAPGGLVVTLAVKHIAMNDTQACVEHRHVLSGAAEEAILPSSGAAGPSWPPPNSAAADAKPSPACSLDAMLLIPPTQSLPLQIAVVCSNPRLLIMRKMTQVSNCLLLMPASSTAKKGDVKRAVDTQAMALACHSLQLYVPGDACQPAPEYGEELIANFFDDRGDGSVMEDWLNDPTSVEDIIGSSLKITLDHKVPEPTTQTADPSSAAGQTPQGSTKQASSASSGTQQGPEAVNGRFSRFKSQAQKVVFQPMMEILGEARRRATSRTAGEEGLLYMNLDLKNPAGQDGTLFTEDVQRVAHQSAAGSSPHQQQALQGQKVHFAVGSGHNGTDCSHTPSAQHPGAASALPKQAGQPGSGMAQESASGQVSVSKELSSTSFVFSARQVTGFTCQLAPGAVSDGLLVQPLQHPADARPLRPRSRSRDRYGFPTQSHVPRSSLAPPGV
ncbi:MAG: hypothetical protein WDW38_007315 [Sanguina aurantia]